LYQGTTSPAAEKPDTEGDGGFNPRVKPIESLRALAPEVGFSGLSPENKPFSAASSVVPKMHLELMGFSPCGITFG
jgi:hypothetical protein